MRVYLAGAWSRREEIRVLRDELNALGIAVTSRWLDEHPAPTNGKEKFLRETALYDLADIRDSDVLVRVSDDLSAPYVASHLATGARMVEMGYALGRGIPVVVVGGVQNVFDRLPNVVHVKDVGALKRYLSPVEVH